ncbi:MAG TPA: hypothetical protein VGC08_01595, partial [Pedobacter sp.]
MSLSDSETPFIVQLSFDHVIENLEKTAATESGERAVEARSLLGEVALHPEFRDGITDARQIERLSDLLTRLMSCYFAAELTKNEINA